MTSPHPMFVSIFRAYGVAPVERLRALDHDSAEDDALPVPSTDGGVPFGDETCRGCGVTREQNDHCQAPCPFDDCPFKETK